MSGTNVNLEALEMHGLLRLGEVLKAHGAGAPKFEDGSPEAIADMIIRGVLLTLMPDALAAGAAGVLLSAAEAVAKDLALLIQGPLPVIDEQGPEFPTVHDEGPGAP